MSDPDQTSIKELAESCRKELTRFQSKRAGSTGFCLELFRLAIVKGSQQAWEFVYAQFYDRMINWVGQHTSNPEDLAHEALEKFLGAVTPEIFARFTGIGNVLSYLKRCARSVHIDRRRQEERERMALETLGTDATLAEQSLEKGVLDSLVNQRCAAHVHSRLQDEQERLVVRLNIELGIKPSEIARQYPDQFPTARHVSRVRERVIRRMSEDPMLREKYKITN